MTKWLLTSTSRSLVVYVVTKLGAGTDMSCDADVIGLANWATCGRHLGGR